MDVVVKQGLLSELLPDNYQQTEGLFPSVVRWVLVVPYQLDMTGFVSLVAFVALGIFTSYCSGKFYFTVLSRIVDTMQTYSKVTQ